MRRRLLFEDGRLYDVEQLALSRACWTTDQHIVNLPIEIELPDTAIWPALPPMDHTTEAARVRSLINRAEKEIWG